MEKRNAEISRLFIQYHDVLKKYILSYTSYDPKYLSIADDYVQEVFYKAIKNYDQLKESPNTFGWLARCFTNMFRSEYRREKRREEIIGRQTSIEQCPEAMDTMDSILRWLSRIEEKELLDELLVTLTPFERTIFYEYFENRQTIHEIAENADTLKVLYAARFNEYELKQEI